MQDDWMKEKREFLNNLSRLPHASSNAGVQSVSTNAIQPYQGSTAIAPLRVQDTLRSSDNISSIQKKAAAYADVVMRLNEARERSLPFKVSLGCSQQFHDNDGLVILLILVVFSFLTFLVHLGGLKSQFQIRPFGYRLQLL
jgi:hypothetical protein